jgi:hypothetical protein
MRRSWSWSWSWSLGGRGETWAGECDCGWLAARERDKKREGESRTARHTKTTEATTAMMTNSRMELRERVYLVLYIHILIPSISRYLDIHLSYRP